MSEAALTFDVVPPDAPVIRLLSHLQPTPERREELERRCVLRIDELAKAAGLNEDGTIVDNSWMSRRMDYQNLFDNDLDFRKTRYPGAIFSQSNLSMGIAQRMARETHAKAADDLVGTRPFFAAVKTDTGNDSTARAVEELIQQRVDRSGIQLEIRSALRSAGIRNECVVKIRYVRRATPYYGPATVMVDDLGNPLRTPNGLLVYENDDFLPDPAVEGLLRHKKDPLFAMTEGQYHYRDFPRLAQEMVEYEGVEVRELDFRSFLFPLDSPDLHEADFVAQLFDETPENIREVYGDYEGFDAYWKSSMSELGSGESQPKIAHGENDQERSAINVRRCYAECYLFFDADGDGRAEHVFAVLDRSCGKLIFAEYLANLLAKRPFEMIPGLSRVPNRAYGEGVIQAVMDSCTYIDAQFNRENVKDSQEHSVDFIDRMGIKDLANGEMIEFGRERPYEVTPGYSAEHPPLFRIDLLQKSEFGREMMREAMQQVNLSFGIVSAKDASNTDANQSRTATGILNIERTANLLIKNTEVQQQQAVIRIMEQVTTLVLENLHETELLLTKDGKQLLTINRDEARTIHREIRLLLTRSRSSETISTSQAAIAIAKDFWIMKDQNPIMVRHLRPEYLRQLKGLESPDPDELCPNITDEDIAAWQKQQQTARDAQLKRESREAINFKDLAPSEQNEWVAAMGFQPAPPAERMTTGLLEKLVAVYDKLPPSIQHQLEALVGFQPATTEERQAVQLALNPPKQESKPEASTA